MKVGDIVPTPYGVGEVVLYREMDKIYKLLLSNDRILYCTKQCLEDGKQFVEMNRTKHRVHCMMNINAAYESLETMRKYNFEITCQEKGIANIDYTVCSTCLLCSVDYYPELLLTTTTTDQQQQQRVLGHRLGRLLNRNKSTTTDTASKTTTSAAGEEEQQSEQPSSITNNSNHVDDFTSRRFGRLLRKAQQMPSSSSSAEPTCSASATTIDISSNHSTSSVASSSSHSGGGGGTGSSATGTFFRRRVLRSKSSELAEEISKQLLAAGKQQANETSTNTTNNNDNNNTIVVDATTTTTTTTTDQESQPIGNADDGIPTGNNKVPSPPSSSSELVGMNNNEMNDDNKKGSADNCTTSATSTPTVPVKSIFSRTTSTPTPTPPTSVSPNQTKKPVLILNKPSPPCLVCATPCCKNHSSMEWQKHYHINLCNHCDNVFSKQYIMSILTASSRRQRQKFIDQLMDMYDRIVLLLQYSSEYVIDELANVLDEKLTIRNKWGIGSSSAGIMSGMLGLAATATFFTPAGPPLLVASLLCGGTASAVQTGADVKMKTSEAYKTADRIIALNTLLFCIIRVVNTLRGALIRDQLNEIDLYLFDDENFKTKLNSLSSFQTCEEVYKQHRVSILAGMTATRYSAAALAATTTMDGSNLLNAAEVTGMAGKNARFFSRGGLAAGTTTTGSAAAASTATLAFAQVTGGALAAATLVLEARSLKRTIQSFHEGSDKAKQLRDIKATIVGTSSDEDYDKEGQNNSIDQQQPNDEEICAQKVPLPTTKELDLECQTYLDILARRIRVMTEAEVTKLLLEQNEEIILEQQQQQQQQQLSISGGNGSSHHHNDEQALQQHLLEVEDTFSFDTPFVVNRSMNEPQQTIVTSMNDINNNNNGTTTTGSSPKSTLTPASTLLERIEQQYHKKEHESSNYKNNSNDLTNHDTSDEKHDDLVLQTTTEVQQHSGTGDGAAEVIRL